MTHYILSPKDTDTLTDYIKAATSVIQVALGTLPLKSLDGIPAEVHYMFKEIDDVPSAPACESATVALLTKILRDACNENYESDAATVFNAIRRGEIPGLTTSDRVDVLREELLSKDEVHLVDERDTLKAEVERLTAEWQADVERMCSNLAKRTVERDAAIARAKKAEKFEAVCHCGSRISDHNPMNDGHCPVEMHEPCPFEQQRDTARAAHAEAMAMVDEMINLSLYGLGFNVKCLKNRRDAHLAKYDKDASK